MSLSERPPPRKRWLNYLMSIVLGLVLALVILEIGLRLIPEQQLAQWIASRPIRYQLYRPDPDVGWRHRPGASTRYAADGEYDVQVQINSAGLNDFEHSYEKPAGTFRIVLLGDSFAEGANVPIAEGFPHRLERCLSDHFPQPVEVINAGTAYYATAEELFFLKHEGLRYQPDLVLVAFFIGNDIDAYASRQSDDKWFDALGGYLIELDETGDLRHTWVDWQSPSPYEQVSSFEIFLRRYSKLYFVLGHSNSKLNEWLTDLRKAGQNWLAGAAQAEAAPPGDFRERELRLMLYHPDFPTGPETPPKLVEAWQIIEKLFAEMQAVTSGAGAEVGVLIIPEKAQASEQHYQQEVQKYASIYGLALADVAWDYASPNEALIRLLAEQQIPALDLLPHFRAYHEANKTVLYFEEDAHLNRTGHHLTAEVACRWLIDNELLQ